MKKKLLTKQVITTGILVGFLFPVFASAAYQIEKVDTTGLYNKDFVVGPGKVEVELKPGEHKTIDLKISNRMGGDQLFKIEVEDFKGSTDPSQAVVLLGSERGPYSLKDFLSVPEYAFVLHDGDKATVPVTISIPTDAQPGGKYGSVLISTVPKNSATSTQVSGGAALVARIGTLFFVKVPGDVVEKGEVKKFEAIGGKVFGSGPIDFRILYENTGSVYLNPYGEIKISNILGEEVGSLEVDPWFSLPGSIRLREIKWDREFLFGRYSAVASINRGYGNIVDSKEFVFWVLPWKIILAAFVALIVLVLVIRFIVTRFEIRKK